MVYRWTGDYGETWAANVLLLKVCGLRRGLRRALYKGCIGVLMFVRTTILGGFEFRTSFRFHEDREM